MNRGTPMSNSGARKRLAEARRGDEAGDVEALRALCLSHFRLTEHGWRYFPTDAANAILASDWLAARDAEQRRLGAEAVVAAIISPAVLEEIGWRISHYGPLDAEPFQYSRFASPAHAAFSAVEDAARAAAQQVSER